MTFDSRYIIIISVLFSVFTSCSTLQPEPDGRVNYGFVSTITNDSLKYHVQLPDDFDFSKVKLTPTEHRILFGPYSFLYAGQESIPAKYKTIVLEYPDSN
ncbi:MAG: hypothetical protein EOP45_17610, partial [Sphingobacteriaceae bacterium]